MEPAQYEAWYETPRGGWIAAREFALLWRLMMPRPRESLLDVGCGTGHFSRRFAAAGLAVTGIDPDPAAIGFARSRDGVAYVRADAGALPFATARFDWVTAVTSLCFVSRPRQALAEAWRVARRGVALGLLNRRSLLYLRKRGRGAYAGARWDSASEVRRWVTELQPVPRRVRVRSAVFVTGGGSAARLLETLVPTRIELGAFLAVVLDKPGR